jgi:Flp pilus assembly protein TadD
MMKARGKAFLSLGHYREALAAFREALSLDPDDADAQQGVRNAEAALGTVNAEGLDIAAWKSPENGPVKKE